KRPAQSFAPLLSPAQRITKPAAKYGVPLAAKKVSDGARRLAERKAAAHKPRPAPPAAPQRRVSQVGEERKKHEDAARKKRMELIENERKQREQMLLLKAGQMKREEKEKMNRINQAREQGWKHVLGSSGGSSPDRKGFGKRVASLCPGAGPSLCVGHALCPGQAPPPALDAAHGRAGYNNYHGAPSREDSPVRGVPAAAGPLLPTNPDAVRRELQRLQSVSRQAHINRHRAQVGAGKACQVEEFLQRKREAMLNKVRAEGHLEYLTRLRQIRLQNFNERQQMKARLRGEKYDSDGSDSQESSEEAELRRKKQEVLKAQANVRAAVLKEQLDKKRKEASEREMRAWEEHLAARGVKVAMSAAGDGSQVSSSEPTSQPAVVTPPPADPDPAPTPVISMTAALKDVGVNFVRKEDPLKPEAAVIQSEKKEILRRLNQNRPPRGEEEEENEEEQPRPGAALPPLAPLPHHQAPPPAEERPGSGGDRRRWEAGAPLVLAVAQDTLEDSCIADQTVGEVIRMGVAMGEGPRKAWGRSPDSLVLRVLQEAELQSLTQTTLEDISTSCQDKTHLVEREGTRTSPPPAVLSGRGVKGQEEEVATAGVKAPAPDPDQGSGTWAGDGPGRTSELTEILDPPDLESVVLGACTQQRARSPRAVQQVWQQLPPPPEGAVAPAETSETEKPSTEKHSETAAPPPWEEPLFSRLCSPAHRRTLALLSAQSSMDDSSSSVASRSRSVSPLRSSQHRQLLLGLTCSLPDLSRLFSSPPQHAVVPGDDPAVAPDNHLEVEDLEAKDEDQSEAEEGYEDEDLRELRASMERLLQEDEEFSRSPPGEEEEEEQQQQRGGGGGGGGGGDLNGNPAGDVAPPLCVGGGAQEEEEEEEEMNQMVEDDDEEEEEEDEEEDDEESIGSPADEEVEDLLTNGVEEEEHSSGSKLNEEWHSDSGGDVEEEEEVHQDSIFSRLEELRFNLEQLMGFENFIEAYNKIKAIHEDEDENIELGSSLVLSILGTQHQHLYPNILHLVMADGAYQEDNDE
ncbi:hypothetical protein CRUP_030678, partial [Coryphaenoides rupestris]